MSNPASLSQRPDGISFAAAVLIATVIVGILDALGASINFWIGGGEHSARIWRFVASGVFGKPALTGGTDMVVYGLLFHFLIAFGSTVVFFLLYRRLPMMGTHPYVTAIVYALIVWAVTNEVIVPLSNTPKGHFNLSHALINAGILVLTIGLPLSLLARLWIRPVGGTRRVAF